jgi:hypothetical protein
MPDDTNETAAEVEEQESNEAGAKPPKTFARRANSNLRIARRSMEAVDWQPDERAQHYLAEANILALLEVADAIREVKKDPA